ncbi:hypothetical protein [Streptomyces sp. DH12]|uniref:hypothetical protein n=1 Tax=Streptomyces sp. DH12 TaxID=2857010 RepID=UPI001E60D081|nr:hypothetical protein [Streptomyces sp. DH12]
MEERKAWFVIAPGISAEYEFDDYEWYEASETQGSVYGRATGQVRVDLAQAERDF